MGDFESTFGAGADATSIIEGFSRDRAPQSASVAGKIRRLVKDDTVFAEIGGGLKLIKKGSIQGFYDEASELDRDERLYGNNYTLFISYGAGFSPEYATESLDGALLLALKDSENETRALIGILQNQVRHLLGLKPKRDRRFSDPLFNVFRMQKWRIGTSFSQFGWVANHANEWFSTAELPPNFTTASKLDLSESDVSSLPEKMTVSDDLDLSYTKIEFLDSMLTVGGNLKLQGNNLKRLPQNITVGGRIYVDKFQVVFPTQEPDLELGSRPHRMISQSTALVIGGNLYLDRAALSILPKGSVLIDFKDDVENELHGIGKLPEGIRCLRDGSSMDF